MDKYADRVESISIAMDIGGMDMGLGELVFDDITKYIKIPIDLFLPRKEQTSR